MLCYAKYVAVTVLYQITEVRNICYGFLINTKATQCQNGTGFMPWYKLSRTDCATVTHLYKLRPNTEQRHAIRTVRNIVKEHRWALHHRHVYMPMRCITSRKVCARRTALWGDYAKVNMGCSMPYRADLSQPYPSPTASKIFSPNPNESMSQLFILLTH